MLALSHFMEIDGYTIKVTGLVDIDDTKDYKGLPEEMVEFLARVIKPDNFNVFGVGKTEMGAVSVLLERISKMVLPKEENDVKL